MPMETFNTEAIVVGAGVVGLAIARKLVEQGKEVVVLEANSRFGEETSSRNSEVIHAGIYYPAHSLKAESCVKGRVELYKYCAEHRVPAKKLGKWIVANSSQQAERLIGIRHQAAENGVDLQWGSDNTISAGLPAVNAVAALWSPETGIVDSHQLMLSFVKEIASKGGYVVYNTRATRIAKDKNGHCVYVSDQETSYRLIAPVVINAAGLGSVSLASACDGMSPNKIPELYYAKGCYFSYSAKHPFESLVYPLPENGGLGIHLTLDLARGARFGPNVEWLSEPDFDVDEALKEDFYESIRNWWPSVRKDALSPAYAGIRPKLKAQGEGFFDFQILGPEDHDIEGMVHLFGIESPGLTSSLAIADIVTQKLLNG